MTDQKIKRALISVSDKTGIVELAKFLSEQKVEIISTGGTFKLLKQNHIQAKDISEFTGFPEIMDGRVKTLHPKVHGALLAVLDNKEHQKQAKENDISSIDLAIINLYPFVETVKKGAQYDEVIENIDIGGPSMIRSAAKNHLYKTVITNAADYENLKTQMQKNHGATTLEYRKEMARKAFTTTANYDQAISDYFTKNQQIDFAPQLILPYSLKQTLRYGENAHQKAALYAYDFTESGITSAKQLQGKELSYNNFNDADAAFNIVLEFSEPAVAIVKHANPCGVAIDCDISSAYKKAFEADSKSAFGGIVALNRIVDKELANVISQIFYEVIIAPDFSNDALQVFEKKKNLRLLKTSFAKQENQKQIRSISGGLLVQDIDDTEIKAKDLKTAGNQEPNKEQKEQQIFAMKICRHIKSNAIVVVNNFQTVGIGAGQMNRVDSVGIACEKAAKFVNAEGKIINKAIGGILASDAFFPFPDNIEIAHKYGISAIVAPSGSIKDPDVISACNAHKIPLSFISSRHFRH
ncbi:MAG: bifunctional phosphoribosylaminoimidazolecarboxamide formyltransferase/IMP cyclohydrolase [Rickettsiaceae bacterium]|nr:bifunctional phosphoribosylaminoimidazolecarboxamide formyltransferase/IMP cyclohydrolase [Rickettsiaceae bacterium]